MQLRRIFTLKLATVREDGEPTRRRALRSEFSDEEWRLVSELADHPNRLLVTATPEARRDLRRGGARGDLPALGQAARMDRRRARVPGLENRARSRSPRLAGDPRQFEERRAADGRGADAGAKLACEAPGGFARRRSGFHRAERKRENGEARPRARRVQALIYVLLVGIIVGLVGVIEQADIKEQVNWVLDDAALHGRASSSPTCSSPRLSGR